MTERQISQIMLGSLVFFDYLMNIFIYYLMTILISAESVRASHLVHMQGSGTIYEYMTFSIKLIFTNIPPQISAALKSQTHLCCPINRVVILIHASESVLDCFSHVQYEVPRTLFFPSISVWFGVIF